MNKLLDKVEHAVSRHGFVLAFADAILERVAPTKTALAYDLCYPCRPNCTQKCCWYQQGCGYCACDDPVPCQPC